MREVAIGQGPKPWSPDETAGYLVPGETRDKDGCQEGAAATQGHTGQEAGPHPGPVGLRDSWDSRAQGGDRANAISPISDQEVQIGKFEEA